jgi:hypothetical protein
MMRIGFSGLGHGLKVSEILYKYYLTSGLYSILGISC